MVRASWGDLTSLALIPHELEPGAVAVGEILISYNKHSTRVVDLLEIKTSVVDDGITKHVDG